MAKRAAIGRPGSQTRDRLQTPNRGFKYSERPGMNSFVGYLFCPNSAAQTFDDDSRVVIEPGRLMFNCRL